MIGAMIRPALTRALAKRSFVTIHREKLVDFTIDGFVVAATDQLVLLQPVRERLDLDGYDVVRMVDITAVKRVSARERGALRRRSRPRGPGAERPEEHLHC